MGKINDLTENITKESLKEKAKNTAKKEAVAKGTQFARQGLDGSNLTTSTKNDGETSKDDVLERAMYRQAEKIKESHDKKNTIKNIEKGSKFTENNKSLLKSAEQQTKSSIIADEENIAIFSKREAEKKKELRDRQDQEKRRLDKEDERRRRNIRNAQNSSSDYGSQYNRQNEFEQKNIKADELAEENGKEFEKLSKKKKESEKLEKLKQREKEEAKREKSGKFAKLGKGEEKINSGNGLAKLRGSEEKSKAGTSTVRRSSTTNATSGSAAKAGNSAASRSVVKEGAKAVAEDSAWWIIIIVLAVFFLLFICIWVASISADESDNQTINSVDTTGYDTEAAQTVFSYLYDVFDGNIIAVCGVMGNLYCESAGTMHGNQLEDGPQSMFGLPAGIEGDTMYTDGIDNDKYVGHPHFMSGSNKNLPIIEKFAHDYGAYYKGIGYTLYQNGYGPSSKYPNGNDNGAGYGIGQFTTSSYKIDIYTLAKHENWKCSVADTKMQLYYMVGTKDSGDIKELGKPCAYDQSAGKRTDMLRDIKPEAFESISAALEYATAVAFTWECGYAASDWADAIAAYSGGPGAFGSWEIRYNHALAFYALFANKKPGFETQEFENSGNFAELEGTYFFQRGSGPCEMCSVANMIYRYCYMVGDEHWNQFGPNMTVDSTQQTFYETLADTPGQGMDKYANSSMVRISKDGKEDVRTGRGWGVESIPDSETIIIHDVKCRWQHIDRKVDKAALLLELQAHPEGVVVWQQYCADGGHAKLVTGYDTASNDFTTLDPGKYDNGGNTTCLMSVNQCWQSLNTGTDQFIWEMSQIQQDEKFLKKNKDKDKDKDDKTDKDNKDKDKKDKKDKKKDD